MLDIIEEEGILEHTAQMGAYLLEKASALDAHPSVGEIRGLGLILGIELVRDKDTKEPFPASIGFHKRLNKILLDKGLSVGSGGGTADWVNGDDLRFYPPLIITRSQIDEVIAMIDEGLSQLEAELKREGAD